MVFTLGPSAHLRSLATLADLGTLIRSSYVARFVQGGVVKTFRWTPQVISDSDRAELNLLAARHGFTGVGCEVREIADRLLNAGVDSDDLVTIYLADADDRSTIVPAFERFLQACDIAIPDRDTAVWGVLEHHISLIARRAGNPRDLCRTMVDEVYYQYDFRCNEYAGDSHGIHHLIGNFYGFDDLMDRPAEVSCNGKYGAEAIIELENELVNAASAWLDEFRGRANP